ncbi:hypothetical protein N7520_009177 [Penicillium odoratum]|uniref:uncharacterized protein n=1 Tax=Penicillium odoratum TaxID=1167516 RepID=UPI002549A573|nr:uncharacterized protein N7520_009177 [Penicillium odoratum]KAJ5752260.1 hypothetical protein N7520_009177 [Penicillium odoratum]
MIEWCKDIGYRPVDFNTFNAIHIAGSKGKGSTAAFVFSILSEYLGDDFHAHDKALAPIKRVGLYTSPHLCTVRERIRIRESQTTDFSQTALDEAKFARYLMDIWDRLGLDNRPPSQSPPFAKFLTLLGFHVFLEEEVDTAIVEVCIGGRYDSTNILCQPSVCAITNLELEHTDILGNKIEGIAWAKGGIMKAGVPVFTPPQAPEAMTVLEDLARIEGADLHVIGIHPDLTEIELGLAGDFQRINASLAIAIASTHLSRMGYKGIPEMKIGTQFPLPERFRRGLENARWPGRCDIRDCLGIRWLLDGAHTMDSMEALGPWVAKQLAIVPHARRILIFNQQTKDTVTLLRHLWQVLLSAMDKNLSHEKMVFHQAIFSTNTPWKHNTSTNNERVSMTYSGMPVDDLKIQIELARCWIGMGGGSPAVTVVRSFEEAMQSAASGYGNSTCKDEGHIRAVVLITGSLHLVGSAIEVLDAISG